MRLLATILSIVFGLGSPPAFSEDRNCFLEFIDENQSSGSISVKEFSLQLIGKQAKSLNVTWQDNQRSFLTCNPLFQQTGAASCSEIRQGIGKAAPELIACTILKPNAQPSFQTVLMCRKASGYHYEFGPAVSFSMFVGVFQCP